MRNALKQKNEKKYKFFKTFTAFSCLTASLMLMPTDFSAAQSIETNAKQAYLFDFDTGTILLNKDANAQMYPASMTKLMTAYIVFERLKNGSLSLDDQLSVSEKAWKKQGSKMFVEVGKKVRIEDLLRGIIIQSGNDATIVVAEGLAGSEEAFAQEMTAKAQELGMMDTNFRNASGWPDENHYTTAHDLGVLAHAIIKNFPEYYHFYSEKSFEFSGINQSNRNPLLYQDGLGADGLKTGHTEISGYGLTASANRDGRRLIMVLNGMDSKRERTTESSKVINWGFREFDNYTFFADNQTILDVPVWLGEKSSVKAGVADQIAITMRKKHWDSVSVKAHYAEPLSAPIVAGAEIGKIVIDSPEMDTIELPLLAQESINELGPMGRISAALKYLVWGANFSTE